MTSAAGDSLAAAGMRVIFTQLWLTLCMWAGILLAPRLPRLCLIQLSRGPSREPCALNRWQTRGRVSPRVKDRRPLYKITALWATPTRGPSLPSALAPAKP